MWLAPAVIFGSLPAVAAWEMWRPRRSRNYPALRRRSGNIGLWLFDLVLAAFIFAPPAAVRPQIEMLFPFGLPQWPVGNPWLSAVAGFLLLDLLRYAVHRVEHAVPVLWRFHALHHSDPDVDTTTAVRHHPIEYVVTSAFYWSVLLILDVPAAVVLAHALAVSATSAVQHGNIRFSSTAERWLQPILVTTDMHRIHHSVVLEQANSNYGAVLSIWDRLLGTFVRLPAAAHDRLVFGVKELPARESLKPLVMLRTPWLLPRLNA